MLCDLVGWKSFRFEGGFSPSEHMDSWVKSKGGGYGMRIQEAPDSIHELSAIEILQGAQTVEVVAPRKKGGWPKGKPRGPRKQKSE
jgi:hypothetical protein